MWKWLFGECDDDEGGFGLVRLSLELEKECEMDFVSLIFVLNVFCFLGL